MLSCGIVTASASFRREGRFDPFLMGLPSRSRKGDSLPLYRVIHALLWESPRSVRVGDSSPFIGASVASFGGGLPQRHRWQAAVRWRCRKVQASEPIPNIPKWNIGIPEWNAVSVLFQVEQKRTYEKFVNVPCLNQHSRNRNRKTV